MATGVGALHAAGRAAGLEVQLRSLLSISPTTNFGLASTTERSDSVDSLSRALMGLSHSIQIVGQAREVETHADWPRPPRLERRWLAVITAEDETTLAWQSRTLQSALAGIGLNCTAQVADSEPSIGPNSVAHDAVHDGSGYAATLVMRRWPREVAPGWLGQALAGDLPVDVAIHFQPQDSQRIARFLKRQQAWQSDLNSPRPDAGNQLGRDDAERVRLKLIARTDRPCKVAIAFTVRAATREVLRQRVETLSHEIGLALGDVRPATFEHDRGLEATLPTGRCNLLGAWRTLDCTSVASTWPFQPATVNHEHGAPLGTTHQGSMLVKLDPFDLSLESFGGIVLAKVGMGKSYFLKLLARRLAGVEVLIVEQRTPAEYGGVAGARVLNLADTPAGQRAGVLRDYVSRLWSEAKADPRPRLLVLDELWSLLRDPELATLIEEIARIGRHHYLALWIATQQVQELLQSGKAVLDNAAVRVYLKQHDRDLEALCGAVGLPAPARRFLRSAARGQALLDVGGMLVPVDIQATPMEHRDISTDPREVRYGMGNLANGRADPDGLPADSVAGEVGLRIGAGRLRPAAVE